MDALKKQNIIEKDYAGIFYFRFWQDGGVGWLHPCHGVGVHLMNIVSKKDITWLRDNELYMGSQACGCWCQQELCQEIHVLSYQVLHQLLADDAAAGG